MDKLFVVRHGETNLAAELLPKGRDEMRALGEKMRRIIAGSVYVMSSPADRAYQSAKILADTLGVPDVEQLEFLWVSGYDLSGLEHFNEKTPASLEKMTVLAKERGRSADNLIVVSHAELCDSFPVYFARNEFGYEKELGAIHKGWAAYLDLKEKTATRLYGQA